VSLEWGSVPQWLTLGGLVIGAATLVSNSRDRRRDQARHVFFVIDSFLWGQTELQNAMVTIHNDSDTPVTDVVLTLVPLGRRQHFWRLRKPRYWWSGRPYASRSFHAMLPKSAAESAEFTGGVRTPGMSFAPPPSFLLRFTDSAGRRWCRWPSGELSQISRVEPTLT
jgi:hypothetical protein